MPTCFCSNLTWFAASSVFSGVSDLVQHQECCSGSCLVLAKDLASSLLVNVLCSVICSAQYVVRILYSIFSPLGTLFCYALCLAFSAALSSILCSFQHSMHRPASYPAPCLRSSILCSVYRLLPYPVFCLPSCPMSTVTIGIPTLKTADRMLIEVYACIQEHSSLVVIQGAGIEGCMLINNLCLYCVSFEQELS